MNQDTAKAKFLEAYDSYADALFRFCHMKVSDSERAQDIVQETYMRYWQALRTGDPIKNERAYLYTLARNLIIDWYRRKKESSLDAITETGFDFAGTSGVEIVEQAEIREALEAIQELDQESYEVLQLRYVEGHSPKDIARILNTTPNVISVRIHRAIKKVQERMHTKEHD